MSTAPIRATPGKTRSTKQLGLRAWMHRVLQECDRAAAGFAPDPVHDLRVAIRRCRSLADGLMAIDPDPSWKEMKRSAKKLFAALGALRDMHVLVEWVEKLSPANDPAAQKLREFATTEETRLKQAAHDELVRFDRKTWRHWSSELPRRAATVRPGSLIYKHLALERWTEGHELHRRAMRTHSSAALHRARIGIKRFRYTVENFLPRQHEEWGQDLKEMQDVLGEVHDLDVLWLTGTRIQAFGDANSRSRWHERIQEERGRRLERYRERMCGQASLWRQWREPLPQGRQIEAGALARLKVWARILGQDFAHAQHVARLAGELWDGLAAHGLAAGGHGRNLRRILTIAALAHDVGRPNGQHQPKVAARLLRKLRPPIGWSAQELALAAAVVRYQDGTWPRTSQKAMRRLPERDRKLVPLLAGILRVADALDADRSGRVCRLMVEIRNKQLYVYAHGYSPGSGVAEQVTGARHLLETYLRRSILVRPLRAGGRKGRR